MSITMVRDGRPKRQVTTVLGVANLIRVESCRIDYLKGENLMKRFICAAVAVALMVSAATGFDDGKKNVAASSKPNAEDKTKDASSLVTQDRWMKNKQRHAQGVFAALTEGDFEKLSRSADLLYRNGIFEKWLADRKVSDDSEFEGQNNAFEYSIKELRRTAGRKDIVGALNAYVMMTQSCVRCHTLIRDDKPGASQ